MKIDYKLLIKLNRGIIFNNIETTEEYLKKQYKTNKVFIRPEENYFYIEANKEITGACYWVKHIE